MTALLISSAFAHAGDLTLEITNLKSSQGEIFIAMWDSAKGFPKDYNTAIETKIIKATNPKVILKNLKPGDYAIAIFHDKNSNQNLDTNSLGIPTEGFGFSNNPKLLFGPPSWNKARFKVNSENSSKIIKMKYF